MKFLGIDLGEKRVGLAISDKTAMISSPFKMVERQNLLIELPKIIEKEDITDIVIGLPKHMNNSHGDKSEEALKIKAEIKKLFDVEVHLQDERRSTIAADEIMKKSNMSRKKRKSKIDEMAAAIILQNFLDRREKDEKTNL